MDGLATDRPVSTAALALPTSIQRLISLAIDAVDPVRIVLYGSRARGGARRDSDYDLAVVFPRERHGAWVRFLVELEDAPITLLPVDMLDWNEAPASLRERIHEEGISLYERTTTA